MCVRVIVSCIYIYIHDFIYMYLILNIEIRFSFVDLLFKNLSSLLREHLPHFTVSASLLFGLLSECTIGIAYFVKKAV